MNFLFSNRMIQVKMGQTEMMMGLLMMKMIPHLTVVMKRMMMVKTRLTQDQLKMVKVAMLASYIRDLMVQNQSHVAIFFSYKVKYTRF